MLTPGLDDPERARAQHDQVRAGNGAGSQEADWPPLRVLPDETLPPAPALPPDLLPRALRPWLVDAAERMQAPLELVATPALVLLGGLIGRRLVIYPKRRDDWIIVPNLWGATVTRPGFLKSPAQHEAIRFVARLAAQAQQAFAALRAQQDVERDVIDVKLAQLKREAARARGVPDALRGQLVDLHAQRERTMVTPTRYYTNDPTVEKLGELLVQNPEGLIVLRDELAGWLRTLDKPGHQGDREFYLEAWNGTGPLTVDRITRGTLHMPGVAVAVVGTMQPGKLRTYVTEALADGRGADGLLQRFQLVAWPDVDGAWVNVDRAPDVAAREWRTPCIAGRPGCRCPRLATWVPGCDSTTPRRTSSMRGAWISSTGCAQRSSLNARRTSRTSRSSAS
jgi:hypothetical protein